MNEFQEFFNNYPRRTGIGAARRAFHNQIMFYGADADYMVKAAKAYGIKVADREERFIQKPVTFLTDQTYLDEDLKASIERKERVLVSLEEIPEELRGLAEQVGIEFYNSWFADAEIEGNTIKLSKWKFDFLTTNHPIDGYELESK